MLLNVVTETNSLHWPPNGSNFVFNVIILIYFSPIVKTTLDVGENQNDLKAIGELLSIIV